MTVHRRHFHLHLNQDTGRPGQIRWSITRSLWAMGEGSRAATLATGTLDLLATEGTPLHTARVLLRAVIDQVDELAAQDELRP